MSYSGYDQLLCEKGHLYYIDAFDYGADGKCPHCKSECIFFNVVHTTNEGDEEETKIIFEVVSPPVICTCKCGNAHCTEEGTYKVPDGETRGHKCEPGKYPGNPY